VTRKDSSGSRAVKIKEECNNTTGSSSTNRSPFKVVVSQQQQKQKQQQQHNLFDTSSDYYDKESSILEWTIDRFSTEYFSCGTCSDTCNNDNNNDNYSRSTSSFTSAITSCTPPSNADYNHLNCKCSGDFRNDDDGEVYTSDTSLRDSQEDNHFYRKTRESLYRKTMMTAATINDDNNDVTDQSTVTTATDEANTNSATNANANVTTTDNNNKTTNAPQSAQRHLKNTARFARGFADDASRAIGKLLPTASLQNITARKYTLPDKTVASQVLMYRQLLHTKCRPGLKLSRPFQATPAQMVVMHMPWWEEGIEESKKMIISYDNLITRLWLNGAIEPYRYQNNNKNDEEDLLLIGEMMERDLPPPASDSISLETFITDEGLPPIPHKFWVDRLGFQQPDPVTDFRSGGVLSLAMMVYMVESKPIICQRFFTGDTAVLPFGITCINVTDMIAKFLMLAKSTDRMDALLSQKPFWKMFADPNAITAVQELAMSMLCDVAVELGKEKRIPYLAEKSYTNDGMPGEARDKVTVFDFSTILERTEKRVRDDLLGAGPKTVDELRSIAGRLRIKYQNQLERRIQRAKQRNEDQNVTIGGDGSGDDGGGENSNIVPPLQIQGVMDKASNMAGGLFAKVKSAKFRTSFTNNNSRLDGETESKVTTATIVDLPPLSDTPTAAATSATLIPVATTTIANSNLSGNISATSSTGTEGDWEGTDIAAATDAISNFSIGDDEEEDADLLL